MCVIEIEDFLPKIKNKELESLITYNINISWTYKHYFTYNSLNEQLHTQKFLENDNCILSNTCGVLVHSLIDENKPISNFHQNFDLIPKFINKKFQIKIKKIINMRINFVTPLGYNSEKYSLPHIDTYQDNVKTFIYYITDSDGDTVIFNERYIKERDKTNFPDYSKKTIQKRINPKQNKAIMFDSTQYHAFCRPSNKIRAVINMNLLLDDN